jgi:glycosyltransferase involved in cell wall biosynthesis
LINIIIPYYNASKTIERALHSIAAQTACRKVIVTIVDDCSDELIEYWNNRNELMVKDSTETFLYENIFPKFSSLNINYICSDVNRGPGAARNIGIENSFCDWVMFLDADDALANPLTIEIINKEIQLNRPDIFITRFQQQTFSTLISMKLDNTTWLHGKVFNRNFLIENKIKFPEIRANEDSAFCSIAFKKAKNIQQLDFLSYIWINNRESMTRADEDYYGNFLVDYILGREFVYNYLFREFGESEELTDELLTACLTIYWQFIDLKNYRPDIVNSYLEEVKNYLRITNLNNYLKDDEFIRRLKIRYWDKKVKPHYGPLIPDIGLIEFYESLYSGIYNWGD